MYRIGFDVGGTFTDFTYQDQKSGRIGHLKVPSTPADPARAIAEGLGTLLAEGGIDPAEVAFVGHGTTVATNMVIERRGAKTALMTTTGCRDVLEIGRQTRPELYDYAVLKPAPLVPRRRRLEVTERLDANGDIVVPLDEATLAEAIACLGQQNIEAVAICFLHSYANPRHEKVAAAALAAAAPDLYVSLSSNILPEFREYERTSTTVLNAYVGPRMADYLEGFADTVAAFGISVEPYTIHSNGGVISIATARDFPVRTCLSGPAAGVVGAAEIAVAAGFADAVSFDVGGTSTDVSLIRDGQPLFTSNRAVAGYPVKCPMIDVHVIGAGGGSIARVDDAGALAVGPESAGALPGPAAYAQGGGRATLTDANLVLGRLGPKGLIAGGMPLDRGLARDAIVDDVAGPLAMEAAEAALGVITIAVSNMSRAIRSVSTERGHDLADFALVAYGGAGPLHAAAVARELGIGRVVVPVEPGTLSARGILMSEISLDFVSTLMRLADDATWPDIRTRFAGMRQDGEAWLRAENIDHQARRFETVIDARYRGQNHEVSVPMGDDLGSGPSNFVDRFTAAHALEHGYDLPGHAVEIVNCRLKAVGSVTRAQAAGTRPDGSQTADPFIERRSVYYGGHHGWIETPIYARHRLARGNEISGPAIIEEMSATTLVLPGQHASVDREGNIVISVGEAE